MMITVVETTRHTIKRMTSRMMEIIDPVYPDEVVYLITYILPSAIRGLIGNLTGTTTVANDTTSNSKCYSAIRIPVRVLIVQGIECVVKCQ